jgi:hypothetical protein
VWRRLEPADFQQTHGLMKATDEEGMWLVCDRYEIRGDEIVATRRFSKRSDEWTAYFPLRDVPDLFLRFGRLHTEMDFEEGALAFTHKYGLPEHTRETAYHGVSVEPTPEKMSLSRFREEARRAWSVLSLYESVLNGDVRAVRDVLSEHRNDKALLPTYELFRTADLQDDLQNLRNELLGFGLLCAVNIAEETVHRTCRQRISFALYSDRKPDLSTVNTFWEFDNLLGAMYLQMWWLMASAGDITRCEFCGRIVSLARSHPEGRKRRRDKRFCDDACRQAHHRSK